MFFNIAYFDGSIGACTDLASANKKKLLLLTVRYQPKGRGLQNFLEGFFTGETIKR